MYGKTTKVGASFEVCEILVSLFIMLAVLTFVFTTVICLTAPPYIQSKQLESNVENRCDHAEVPFHEWEAGSISLCHCSSFDAEFTSCMAYLRENIPPFDVINEVTLGFIALKPVGEDGSKSRGYAGIDGLDLGIVNVGVNNSLSTKMQYPWASKLSKALFYEFVLPYAVVSAISNLQSPSTLSCGNRLAWP